MSRGNAGQLALDPVEGKSPWIDQPRKAVAVVTEALSAAEIVAEAELDLFTADSQLLNADCCTGPDSAREFQHMALNSLAAARRRIEQATIAIEKVLYNPVAAGQQ